MINEWEIDELRNHIGELEETIAKLRQEVDGIAKLRREMEELRVVVRGNAAVVEGILGYIGGSDQSL